MKKILAIVICLGLVLSLAACGGAKAIGCEGKYVSVAVTALGITMTGEEAEGFEMVLEKGGKGTCTVDGESAKLTWSLDGSKMTVTIDGEELVGNYSKDKIEFENFMDMGMDCLFAIEGSEAANVEGDFDETEPDDDEDDIYPIRLYAVSCIKDGTRYECDGEYIEFTNDDEGVFFYNDGYYDIEWAWYEDDSFEFTDDEGDKFEGEMSEDDEGMYIKGTYLDYTYEFREIFE